MIKILHIPTGIILELPSYLRFKWLFNLKDEDFGKSGDYLSTSKINQCMLETLVELFDAYYLLDKKDDRANDSVTMWSGIEYLQKERGIEEFEVLHE